MAEHSVLCEEGTESLDKMQINLNLPSLRHHSDILYILAVISDVVLSV